MTIRRDPAPRHCTIARYVLVLVLALLPVQLAAQTGGSIRGRVLDRQTRSPVIGAELRIDARDARTVSDSSGRFVFAALPAGVHELRVSALGYSLHVVQRVPVRPGSLTELDVELDPAAIALEGVVVRAERVRLIDPEVTRSQTVLVGEELRDLPADGMARAIELAPGVSQGHFRGGRIGQESYVVDGIELKNQLEASRQGLVLEFSPNSLEEIEVITGGFGAEYGSALSGVVNLVTRRGSSDHWRGRTSLLSDHAAPASLFRGFTAFTATAGGPARFLGGGATIFADLLAQGLQDAEPRARGLSCLRAEDADAALAGRIAELRSSAPSLYCPYTNDALPHQQGDKLIGFVRLDRALGGAQLTASLLHNRYQRQLYTSEFKYNAEHQLGQRSDAALASAALGWTQHRAGSALNLSLRGAAMRLDRFLGVVDGDFADRAQLAGFGFGRMQFLAEDEVRRPPEEQLDNARPLPGYVAPGGDLGSPFGPAGTGIFATQGTPHVASWSRLDLVAGDAALEYFSAGGAQARAGLSGKLYRVENYERVLAHLDAAAFQYARFYPATASGFFQLRYLTDDDFRLEIGTRVEAFRAGLSYRADRADFLAPLVDTDWKLSVMPRLGAALPFPGSDGRTAVRFNYGFVSQPPDFRYFLDSSIGDSLRTDLQRQGNPNLAFERGSSVEGGISHLIADGIALTLTGFNKQLRNLATGAAGFVPGVAVATVADFGRVRGFELSVRAQRGAWSALGSYTRQRAVGATAGTDGDTVDLDVTAPGEFPLAFDRRHSIDFALFAGRAADPRIASWSASLVSSVQSGYPLTRLPGDSLAATDRLPWTATVDLRATRSIGALPLCDECRWSVVLDGRNLLGRDNLLGLRRETGRVAPRLADVEALANLPQAPIETIPRESPRYSAPIDLDRDGRITDAEYRQARFAAALDRYDPTLFYGEPRLLRLGVEVTF